MKCLFIAPALMVLGVAVQSQPDYIDYEELITDKEVTLRINQYVDVVRNTERVIQAPTLDEQALNEVADQWIRGAEAGLLKPIPTQGFYDSIQSGAKGQIAQANKKVAHHLMALASQKRDQGRFAEAADDYAKALRVLQVLRYSDITSVAIFGGLQRRALTDLRAVWSKLPQSKKDALLPVIDSVRPDPVAYERILRNERRAGVIEDAIRADIAQAQGQSETLDLKASDLVKGELSALLYTANRAEREQNHLIERLSQQGV